MPEVSMIMPVYNAERSIDQAIKSVLAQSFRDYELIIINDGSTDRSLSIINKYAADRRIKIINKQNEGVSAARNDGLKVATGTYIGFIDSDDKLDEEMLEKALTQAAETKADLLMFSYYREKVNQREIVTSQVPVNLKSGHYTCQNPPEWKMDAEWFAMYGYIWNKLFRRELINTHQLSFDESLNYVEDLKFIAQFMTVANRFVTISDCLYHYKRRDAPSLGTTYRRDDFDYQLLSIQLRQEIMEKWSKDQSFIDPAVAYLHVYAVKASCVNLFLNKNNLPFTTKVQHLNQVLHHPLSQQRVKHFQPKNGIEWIFKFTIRGKLSVMLALISGLYSLPQKLIQEKTV